MTLELADGRGELFQWDTGRIIEFGEDAVSQAHFTNTEKVIDIPYTVEVKNRKAAIPDELLQVPGKLIVYAWVSDTNGGYTKVQVNFPVFARPKPSDYVYTPTEHAGFDRLRAEIGDLSALQTDAKDNLVSAINEAAASGGADWAQNDPTAKDYVKNRPGAYKVEKEMKVAVTPDDTNGVTLESFPSFKSGETISFAVNSVKYSVEAIELFPDMPGIAGFRDAKGGWEIACPFGEIVFAISKTEAINITYTAIINVVIPSEFLPSSIVYLKDGSIPTSLLPTDISVFGTNIAAGGSYSTLSNPYPNKVQMPDLTLDKFNQMLNDSIYLPSVIILNHSLAGVFVNKTESCIYVSWNEMTIYGTDGHAIAGASITAYEAKIHEDPKNKGSIISEYAMIKIADNRLA